MTPTSFFVILGLLSALSGCYGRGADEATDFGGAGGAQLRFVDFATLHSAILAPRCIGCHEELQSEDAMLAQSRMVVPGNPEQSPLFLTVRDGSMPRNGNRLAGFQVELIRQYILDLAPPVPVPTGNPVVPTYDFLSRDLIKVSCLPCHRTDNSRGLPELDSYENLRRNAAAALLEVESDRMPTDRSGLPKVRSEVKAALRGWIEAGYPEHDGKAAVSSTGWH